MVNQILTGAKPEKSNEWYTPACYIEAARDVMGGIDLDPASSETANLVVRASHYYTKEDNGLLLPWSGRVWCNPPYNQIRPGHSSIKAWVHRVTSTYQHSEIEQAICLIPNDTSTTWFGWLWEYTICFPTKRIQFDVVGKEHRAQPTFGTCFVYFGSHVEQFIEVFSQFGRIVRAIDTPKPRPIARELWQEVAL